MVQSTAVRQYINFLSVWVAIFISIIGLAIVPQAQAAVAMRGANTHSARLSLSESDSIRDLDAIKKAGGNTIRFDVGWSNLEPAYNSFDANYTARIGRLLDAAQQRNIKVVITLLTAPCWASSAPDSLKQNCSTGWWDRGVWRYPPSNNNYYADIVGYMVKTYGTKIAAIEVWNEPNSTNFWVAPNPAQAYVNMLKVAYTRAKSINKNVAIITGGLAKSDTAFLTQMYNYGLKGYDDGVAVHPYTNTDPAASASNPKDSYAQGVPAIQSVMTAKGESTKGVWITEVGFSSCTNVAICVSEANQASYTQKLFTIADKWSYVKSLIVYDLRNDGNDPANKEYNFGLLRNDYTAKPAYAAFGKANGVTVTTP